MNTKNILPLGILALVLLATGCSESKQIPAAKTITTNQIAQVQTIKHEPTQEEWQASYKKIALNEAASFIELIDNGSLTADRHESMIKVTTRQAEKIKGIEKVTFENLADAVANRNSKAVRTLYTQLGGE
jgi:hypothetical protein